MTENNLVEIEIEPDKEDLLFIEKYDIDLSQLVRDKINNLMEKEIPAKELKLMRLNRAADELKQSIENDKKSLAEVEDLIRRLE